jgi:hypothetical protein
MEMNNFTPSKKTSTTNFIVDDKKRSKSLNYKSVRTAKEIPKNDSNLLNIDNHTTRSGNM